MIGKRGSEEYLSIWDFLVFAVIIFVVMIAVWMYNSAGSDIRGEEARILANRLIDCINQEGRLIEGVLKDDFNIYDNCSLDKTILNSNYFFAEVLINESASGNGKKISIGNGDIRIQCEIKKNEAQFGSCFKSFSKGVLYDSKQYDISVFAGSNNRGGEK